MAMDFRVRQKMLTAVDRRKMTRAGLGTSPEMKNLAKDKYSVVRTGRNNQSETRMNIRTF